MNEQRARLPFTKYTSAGRDDVTDNRILQHPPLFSVTVAHADDDDDVHGCIRPLCASVCVLRRGACDASAGTECIELARFVCCSQPDIALRV